MSRNTPEEVFKTAQQAMQSGDWLGFFSCMDKSDVKKILSNGIKLSMVQHGGDNHDFSNICTTHNLPIKELLDSWKSMQWHHFNEIVKDSLKKIDDLPRLASDIEHHIRSMIDGGSVRKGLFVGDKLDELKITDKTATAIRIIDGKSRQPIKFFKKRDGWYFKLVV